MTTRRRLLVFGLLATLTGLGLGGWLLWPRTAITRENAAKIKRGRTLAEVEAILGGPARNESTGSVEKDVDDEPPRVTAPRLPRADEWTGYAWLSDNVQVLLIFDADERAIGIEAHPMRRIPETTLEMLCRWLGL
jgi:hypothetical protein